MRIALLLLLLAGSLSAEEIDVAAAASLQDALQVIARTYEARTHDRVVFNFAASSILARQIRAGAPTDLFFSADEATMDSAAPYLAPDTRRDLLSNVLVVVSDRPMANVRELTKLRRIAVANPAAVPAGVYARQYLERAGLWNELLPKIVPMENVRAALAAADGGNVDAAIVYRTDALLAKHSRIVLTIDGPDAPVIAYPVAMLRDAKHAAAARRFLAFVESAEGLAIFRRFGFVVR